jgi:hypothetical protein
VVGEDAADGGFGRIVKGVPVEEVDQEERMETGLQQVDVHCFFFHLRDGEL